MSRRTILFARLWGLIARNRLDRELDEELRFHLEMQTEDNRRAGMSPEQARHAAIRRFGALESVKEEYRQRRTFIPIETTIGDIRYGFRTLCRARGFAAVAVLSLALGIGGNTAIFSLLDTVLLKRLPVRDPEQLVLLSEVAGRSEVQYFSEPVFERIRAHKKLLVDVLASFDAAGTLQVSADLPGSGGSAEMVPAQLVSGNYHSVLGVPAFLGRTLEPDDDETPEAHPVAVLSYSYWRRHFANDRSVVGKEILLNGRPFTIVGVTRPDFFGITTGMPPDITVPIMMQPQIWLEPGGSILKDPSFGWLRMMARLRPDIPEQKAQAGLTVLFQQVETDFVGRTTPADRQNIQKRHIELTPGSKGLDALRIRFSKPLLILMSLVGLVLLVACANLAALLLARATARRREIAIRLAIGASRGRLIRQLLTESALLSTAGALIGLMLAYAAAQFLLRVLAQSPDHVKLQLALDMPLFAFTSSLAVVSCILFGLFPALQISSTEISRTLPRGGSVFGHFRVGRTRRSYAQILLVVQIAFSLVLLIGAGLFVRSLQNLETVDPGFQRTNLLLVTVNPSLVGYREPRLSNAYEQMLARLAALPGVRSVSMSSHSLVSPGIDDSPFLVPGRLERPNEPHGVNLNVVGPRFFETMGIQMVLGRDFTWRDGEATADVAVITETLARQYFPGESPVGKRVGLGGPLVEIVGVVKDAKYNTLRDPSSRVVYLPFRQTPAWHPPIVQMTFAIRTEQKPLSIAASARHQIQEFDRSLPIVSIKTAEEQVEQSFVDERLIAWLSGGFGGLALILVCVGLVGTMAHSVAQRTGEIGMRMALGARTGDVIWLLVREGLAPVLAGIVLGLAIGHAVTRLATALLFGVTATDPRTILGAVTTLAAVAAIASLLPTLKAARIDPAVTLRHE
jgi:macrolide transport system ATP-binding/permease protein